MIKGFKELHETPKPNENDVVETIQDYAETGAAIYAQIVIDVINRAGLSRDSLQSCLSSAIVGQDFHKIRAQRSTEPGKPAAEMRESTEYAIVAEHIRNRLSSLES